MSILTDAALSGDITNAESYTATEFMKRARALGVSFAFAADKEFAHATLKAGEGLPTWATRYQIADDDAVFLDGDYGQVTIGCTILFDENAVLTSKGVDLAIDGLEVAHEIDASYLRGLAAELIAAADAMESNR